MVKILLQSVCLAVLGAYAALPVAVNAKELAYPNVQENQLSIEDLLQALTTSEKNTYTQIVSDEKPVEIVSANTTYKKVVIDALMFHNLMNSVSAQKAQIPGFKLAVQDKAVCEARIKDFDACNEGLLSPYFAKPKDVWAKLKKETDDRVEDYNLNMVAKAEEVADSDADLLASADKKAGELQKAQSEVYMTAEARAEQKRLNEKYGIQTPSGKTTDDRAEDEKNTSDDDEDLRTVMGDNGPELEISFAVLNLFYPNQDAWGARKSATTSSLPLWEDQKYLYNQKIWQPKYHEIRKHCENQEVYLAMKEPVVTDKIKYDYYFYKDVVAAHNKFIAAAIAQECVLTPAMKAAPQVAPRPLPPVYEEITVLKDDDNKLDQIYPQNPMNPTKGKPGSFDQGTLWEAYKADKYKDVYKDGELNTYFSISSSTIHPRAKTDELDGNRLSKYLLYKEEAKKAVQTYNGYIDAANELKENVKKATDTVEVTLPDDLNYLNEKDLNTVYDLLKEQRDKLLTTAAQQMGAKALDLDQKTPEELQKDETLAYLHAMQYDQQAEVQLTLEKAVTIEESIKEARANAELLKLMNDASNQNKLDAIQGSKVVKGRNFTADRKTCVYPTKSRLLDINSIPIK